jgi:hypothetical protein
MTTLNTVLANNVTLEVVQVSGSSSSSPTETVVGYVFAAPVEGSSDVTQEQRWVLYPGYQAPPEGRVRLRVPTRSDRQYTTLAAWQSAMMQTSGDTLWKENSRYVKVNSKSYATMGSHPAPPMPAAPEPFGGSGGARAEGEAQVASFSQQEESDAAPFDFQTMDKCKMQQWNVNEPTVLYDAGWVFGTVFAPDPHSPVGCERSTNQEYWVIPPGYSALRAGESRVMSIEPDVSVTLSAYLSDMQANHFPAGSTYVISSCVYASYRPGNP